MSVRWHAIPVVAIALAASVVAGCTAPHNSSQTQPSSKSSEPTVAPLPAIEPTPAPAPLPEPVAEPVPVKSPLGPAPADNTKIGWYYMKSATHGVPGVAAGAVSLLETYSGRFVGPNPAYVYLTFDQGYENGNTSTILDALARNDVEATFFVTESYIRANPDRVRRMVIEGHAVGNHSSTHPSMPSLAGDRSAFAAQFVTTEQAFTETTGARMAKIFRPPMGEYSPLSLWITQSLGYESVFWGFAHRDWLVDDQPPVEVTVERILTGSHPGAIYLLHGVSSSDTQALDAAIAGLRSQGYGFGVLGE